MHPSAGQQAIATSSKARESAGAQSKVYSSSGPIHLAPKCSLKRGSLPLSKVQRNIFIVMWKCPYWYDTSVTRRSTATTTSNSSETSRTTACSGVSPCSILPPGNSHWNGISGFFEPHWAANSLPSLMIAAPTTSKCRMTTDCTIGIKERLLRALTTAAMTNAKAIAPRPHRAFCTSLRGTGNKPEARYPKGNSIKGSANTRTVLNMVLHGGRSNETRSPTFKARLLSLRAGYCVWVLLLQNIWAWHALQAVLSQPTSTVPSSFKAFTTASLIICSILSFVLRRRHHYVYIQSYRRHFNSHT